MQGLDEIVGRIYEAAAGRHEWRDALDALARNVDAWLVQIVGFDKTNGNLLFAHEGGHAPPSMIFGFLRYAPLSPRVHAQWQMPMGVWFNDHEHFDEQFVARDRFYQEFLIPSGGRYLSSTKLVDDDRRIVLLAIHRGVGQRPLSDGERTLLESLRLHLQRALTIEENVRVAGSAARAGHELLDAYRHPIVLVDAVRVVRFRNRAADELLSRQTHVLERRSRLACVNTDDDAALGQAIAALQLDRDEAAEPETPGLAPGAAPRAIVRMRGAAGRRPISAVISRLRPRTALGAFGPKALALVLFLDPRQARKPDPLMVAEALDLTPAEARIACQLAEGLTSAQIARANRVTIATVRSHIKAMFAKTGTNRQVDLVRKISALPGLASEQR